VNAGFLFTELGGVIETFIDGTAYVRINWQTKEGIWGSFQGTVKDYNHFGEPLFFERAWGGEHGLVFLDRLTGLYTFAFAESEQPQARQRMVASGVCQL